MNISRGTTYLAAETRKLLRAIDNSQPQITEAFDRCARLYQVALVCGNLFPSVSLAYQVAAVEAIAQTTGEYGSFAAFMRAHCKPSPQLDEIIEYLYGSIRSAHFHAGNFPGGEFTSQESYFGPLIDGDVLASHSIQYRGTDAIGEGIANWMIGLCTE